MESWLGFRSRLLLVAFAVLLAGRHLVRFRYLLVEFRTCSPNVPVLVGTHHKTGTVLLMHIFRDACPLLGWRCSFDNKPTPCNSPEQARAAGLHLCFLQHGVRFQLGQQRGRFQRARRGGGGAASALAAAAAAPPPAAAPVAPYRFVHIIRDPLESVLSGYQYHLKTTERWAVRPDRRYNGSSYRSYLGGLSRADGLRAEVKHALRDSLKTMPRLLNRTSHLPCTLTVRMEDFEHNWSGTTSRLWDLLGVGDTRLRAALDGAVAKHNVYRRHTTNRHVSNKTERGAMRAQLRALPDAFAQVQRVRSRLGYADTE